MDINKLIPELKKIFSQDERIVSAYLFGSYAKGDFHKRSDIDLAIMLDSKENEEFSLDNYLDLEIKITLAIKIENFDLVIINQAPLVLQFRIISEGRLIYIFDDNIRSDLEARIMLSYYDFQPRLKEFNKEYFEALEERYLK